MTPTPFIFFVGAPLVLSQERGYGLGLDVGDFMKVRIFIFFLIAIVRGFAGHSISAGEIYMSYPGLTGDSSAVWITKETEIFKEYGIDARLIYMEGCQMEGYQAFVLCY